MRHITWPGWALAQCKTVLSQHWAEDGWLLPGPPWGSKRWWWWRRDWYGMIWVVKNRGEEDGMSESRQDWWSSTLLDLLPRLRTCSPTQSFLILLNNQLQVKKPHCGTVFLTWDGEWKSSPREEPPPVACHAQVGMASILTLPQPCMLGRLRIVLPLPYWFVEDCSLIVFIYGLFVQESPNHSLGSKTLP